MSLVRHQGGISRSHRQGSNEQAFRVAGEVGKMVGNTLKRYLNTEKKTESRPAKKAKRSTFAAPLVVHNEGVGGQYTELKWSLPRSYTSLDVLRNLAPQVEVLNTAGQLLVTPGVQNVAGVLVLGSKADYDAVSGTSKITRATLVKARGEVMLANNFKACVRITLYDCIARRDVSNTNVLTPYAAWQQGLSDEGLTGTYTTVGATPFDTDTFNYFWKVLKKTELVLGGGATHRHLVELTGSKLIYGPEGAYVNAFKDVTYYTMMVISGQPAHDSTTKTAVTLGSGGIDYVYQTEHKWKIDSGSAQTISRSNNLATTFAVGEAEAFVGGTTVGTNAEA